MDTIFNENIYNYHKKSILNLLSQYKQEKNNPEKD